MSHIPYDTPRDPPAIHLTLRWELDLGTRTPSAWVLTAPPLRQCVIDQGTRDLIYCTAVLRSRLLASLDSRSVPRYGMATVASFPSWPPSAGSHPSGHRPPNPNMPTS